MVQDDGASEPERSGIEDSVSEWLDDLRHDGDDESARRIWERYFRRLVALSGRKLPDHVKREFDEEDVALSAFNSLCVGVREGRFPDLDDRDDLWSLLVVIAARKVAHRMRDRAAQKRGGGGVRGESIFDAGISGAGLRDVIGQEPSPEVALELAEESARLFGLLDDPTLRELAELKAEGSSNPEIATRLGCGLRTVERRLTLIRRIWMQDAETSLENAPEDDAS